MIGAGVSGLYQLYRLREQGLKVRCLEDGSGVGSTCYWDRYPGCRFDSESETYGYSFSKELLRKWDWKEHYSGQPENERYLNYVADKFDLHRDIQFNSHVTAAVYDEKANRSEVQLESGLRMRAQCLVAAVGILSARYIPPFEGIDIFKASRITPRDGRKRKWTSPASAWQLSATGATAVQLIPIIAKEVGHLTFSTARRTIARRLGICRSVRKPSDASKPPIRISTKKFVRLRPASSTISIGAVPSTCRAKGGWPCTKN